MNTTQPINLRELWKELKKKFSTKDLFFKNMFCLWIVMIKQAENNYDHGPNPVNEKILQLLLHIYIHSSIHSYSLPQ